MTKIDEIKQGITELKAKAKIIQSNPNATIEEIKDIKNKLQVEYEKLELAELEAKNLATEQTGKLHNDTKTQAEKYKRAFFNAIRGKNTAEELEIIRAYNKLDPGVKEDGGILIPVDQQTKINELKKKEFSFKDYMNVEPVSTKTGTRVYEKNADSTGFANLTAGEKMPDINSPQFVEINYDVQDFGGILPVSNTLLDDTDQNIEEYLNKWVRKKTIATENKVALTLIKTITAKTTVTDLDGLKDVLNSKLYSAFKATAMFFMNEDAFNYFAKLKDNNGRNLLEADPKEPTKRIIDGRPVIEVPNDIMPTEANKPLIIVGDLEEFMTMFDRQQLAIRATDIGGTAFETNRTLIRAIERFDMKKTDERAVQVAELDLTATAAAKGVPVELVNTEDLISLIQEAVAAEIAKQSAAMVLEADNEQETTTENVPAAAGKPKATK